MIQIESSEYGVVSKYEFYREDGTLKQTDTFENGVVSKYEFYREDETLKQIDVYENGILKNTKEMKVVE